MRERALRRRRFPPDGRHLLFTRSGEDLGRVDQRKTTMSIIRLADEPLTGFATMTNRLDLGPGWEPHWTRSE